MDQQGQARRQLAALIAAAIQGGLTAERDRIYVYNRLQHRLALDEHALPDAASDDLPEANAAQIPDLLQALVGEAVARGLCQDLTDLREQLAADLMDVLLDKPSVLQARFDTLRRHDPVRATDWFYQICRTGNIIQTRQIARNIVYQAPSPYGLLDITINLAKPEKNPRDIAAARHQKSAGYPRCLLCAENEGYAGRIGHPARGNHRMIGLILGGASYFFQYSPYAYYPEHCIVLSQQHRDMVIDRSVLARLLEFIGYFPHYFIGSNADLPIVGGSILSHDHYQGGRYELPMARAGLAISLDWPRHPAVRAGVLHWPMSVIRLVAAGPDSLLDAADDLLGHWRAYSDPTVDLIARSGETTHNTITPIARRRGADYELDLVLRNNRQSDAHPLGIFHPHADVHHIKKENIGLIEVMGLAVLPARLLEELTEVEAYLQGLPAQVMPYHQAWAEQLRRSRPCPLTSGDARAMVRTAVAERFGRVLADAGIFKDSAAGRAAWQRYLASLGAAAGSFSD